jgi:hypothetical protein
MLSRRFLSKRWAAASACPPVEPDRRTGVPGGAPIVLLVLALASLSAAHGQAPATDRLIGSSTVIQGTLGIQAGKGPTLMTAQKTYILQGQSPYILHVLEDKRLLNQELQLEGTKGANGTFVVSRLYAVRNGRLYKVQYYCEVCNITYVEPGHCYCCGRETKLQEVPVSSDNR